ncbi:hypothetical protein ADK47_03330 [Streptomyces rimosus subsp. rimosus]|nr:hypothetical protein ADK78_11075 [Kitasatospora aureofaciens]KOT42430.1 hypothetical protein ADK84_09890 [Streptomyces sp. NRRL WC-3701]KOT44575.1 hypothetical protein ADK42_04885 [Streptomyces rimosus subsp. rimosus]KOT65642.1 hypothetical protein ADK44_07100 [Streptomyces rimosus subsp. rimosus]KOT67697.1 hypothetical protein ADK45_08740 [Streptomyces rimosus subsp. rimosus]
MRAGAAARSRTDRPPPGGRTDRVPATGLTGHRPPKRSATTFGATVTHFRTAPPGHRSLATGHRSARTTSSAGSAPDPAWDRGATVSP